MRNKNIIKEDEKLVDNLLTKLQSRTPILKNPDGLTDDIMKAIRLNPEQEKTKVLSKPGVLRSLVIIRRLLAAASVCLFLVFGYEEYVVVEKISHLEKQSSAISRSSQYPAALNLNRTMAVMTFNPQIINQYIDIKTKKPDLRTIKSFLEKYSSTLQNRLK